MSQGHWGSLSTVTSRTRGRRRGSAGLRQGSAEQQEGELVWQRHVVEFPEHGLWGGVAQLFRHADGLRPLTGEEEGFLRGRGDSNPVLSSSGCSPGEASSVVVLAQ